jgi:hypothetical protein
MASIPGLAEGQRIRGGVRIDLVNPTALASISVYVEHNGTNAYKVADGYGDSGSIAPGNYPIPAGATDTLWFETPDYLIPPNGTTSLGLDIVFQWNCNSAAPGRFGRRFDQDFRAFPFEADLSLGGSSLTAIFNLRASSNATFRWTRNLTQWAALYDLASGRIRMQARVLPYAADPPAFEWVTGAGSGGLATFSAATNLIVFTAPLSAMAQLSGVYYHDCRLEMSDGSTIVLFSGRLTISPGITRAAGDLSSTGTQIGDSVTVDGETALAPVAVPALTTGVNFGQLFADWFANLPTSLPLQSGQFWNNGGILAQS